MNFIEEYLRLTEDLESPTSYLMWGARSCISAVLRDNVFFKYPKRLETIYPNMFILLLGDTSKVRKSNPMNITRNLLKKLNNTKVMAGAASMQGVLKELAMTGTGKPNGGSGILIAKELGGFFVQDPNTVKVLTDLYDYHPLYEKFLATYEMPPIKEVCLSLFAGSNEVNMRNLIDQDAMEGGLVGRMIIISENDKRKSNSGMEDGDLPVNEDDWDKSRDFLFKLSRVKGHLIFSDPARRYYNDWYHSLADKNYNTKTGFEHRIHTHAIKLAAVLSAANSGWNLTIELKELEQAINELGALIPTYKRLTLGTGRSPQATPMGLIVHAILESPQYHISRRDLLVKLYGEIDVETLDKSITTLAQSEFVTEASTEFGVVGYKATRKLLDKMLEKQKTIGMVQ